MIDAIERIRVEDKHQANIYGTNNQEKHQSRLLKQKAPANAGAFS